MLIVPHYFIGVDLGKKCDFTAIAILETRDGGSPHFLTPWTFPPKLYALRHLERMSLGTPYPRIVERISALTREPVLQSRSTIVVDETGVGAPVVDMLRQASLDCDLVPVTITGGEHASRSGHGWSVPKRDILAALMVLIEEENLRIAADLPERRRLVDELMAMHAGAGRSGYATFGASGAAHDDLVLSVALACWRANAGTIGHQSTGRLV